MKSANRVAALAGVFQAAALVKQLAWTGQCTEGSFKTSIESLFKIDANSVADVYHGVNNLKLGLESLVNMIKPNQQEKDHEIARYALSILHLERRLIKKPNMLKHIQQGVIKASNQAELFNSTHANVLANLAGLYTDTLSTFSFRIHVAGEPIHLNQTHVINRIRSLLLAGIRSAVLWQQVGGRRWQLLFNRATLVETANNLLQHQPLYTETTG